MTYASYTPEYRVWQSIKDRCLNPRAQAYARYGGRGITICDRWRSNFQQFIADVGARPSASHSIDRINNDGNYEPGNVRWATAKEQARNRRPGNYPPRRGKPHVERARAECECGLVSNRGPLARHQRATGHALTALYVTQNPMARYDNASS